MHPYKAYKGSQKFLIKKIWKAWFMDYAYDWEIWSSVENPDNNRMSQNRYKWKSTCSESTFSTAATLMIVPHIRITTFRHGYNTNDKSQSFEMTRRMGTIQLHCYDMVKDYNFSEDPLKEKDRRVTTLQHNYDIIEKSQFFRRSFKMRRIPL